MVESLIVRIATCLDEAGIPYMVIGGQAVLAYGEVRLTQDVDVTVGVPTEEAPRLAQVVASVGISPLEDPESFVRGTFVLPAMDAESGMRVDLSFGVSAYERIALERARTRQVAGTAVRFISPEDLVIHKLLAGRSRDIDDTLGILLKQPKLDREYVRTWLRAFDEQAETDAVPRFEELLKLSRR